MASTAHLFDPEFFPTPRHIITKMLARVSKDAKFYLEPSAGRGDIAEVIQGQSSYSYSRQHSVDCIELHPDLAGMLRDKQLTVVGSDWLTYSGVCFYDAIVMNPPWSNADAHLLKAWEFLHDGEIVCVLNAETLRNPYTATRQRLAAIVAEHGDVEELGQCFRQAERPTDAEAVLVYLKKQSDDDTLDLWHTDTPERTPEDSIGADPQWLAVVDTLGNMEHYYNEATVHMLKAYHHLRKAGLYLNANGISSSDYAKICGVAFGNMNSARAEFARLHRKDAWYQVLRKMDFHKWLDKQQTEAFLRDVEREATIPFTKDNIKGTLVNIFGQRQKLFEQSVANVFDALTKYHAENSVHTEGWKSNDNYKVNRKLVFPYGCEFDSNTYSREFRLRWGGQLDIYNDLDRVLCVLDGADFTKCLTIGQALETRFRNMGKVGSSFYNQVTSHYFDIKFFKKGTVHLRFRDEKLWQDFNVTAAKGKAWLGSHTQGHGSPAPEPEPTPEPVAEPAPEPEPTPTPAPVFAPSRLARALAPPAPEPAAQVLTEDGQVQLFPALMALLNERKAS